MDCIDRSGDHGMQGLHDPKQRDHPPIAVQEKDAMRLAAFVVRLRIFVIK